MRKLRILSAVVGFGCLVLGLFASVQNGTLDNIAALGRVLLIAGAIILVGVLINSAIVEAAGRK